MNVQTIDPAVATISANLAASAAPHVPTQAPAAPQPTPAATVQLTQVPASVSADDRVTYLQLLKANGGNAAAALAELKSMEAREMNG